MNAEHLSGYRTFQAIALDFAESLTELIKEKTPAQKVKLLAEASEAAERYSQLYLDAAASEQKLIRIERDRLEQLDNTPF